LIPRQAGGLRLEFRAGAFRPKPAALMTFGSLGRRPDQVAKTKCKLRPAAAAGEVGKGGIAPSQAFRSTASLSGRCGPAQSTSHHVRISSVLRRTEFGRTLKCCSRRMRGGREGRDAGGGRSIKYAPRFLATDGPPTPTPLSGSNAGKRLIRVSILARAGRVRCWLSHEMEHIHSVRKLYRCVELGWISRFY
jgi:hypothetical protein